MIGQYILSVMGKVIHIRCPLCSRLMAASTARAWFSRAALYDWVLAQEADGRTFRTVGRYGPPEVKEMARGIFDMVCGALTRVVESLTSRGLLDRTDVAFLRLENAYLTLKSFMATKELHVSEVFCSSMPSTAHGGLSTVSFGGVLDGKTKKLASGGIGPAE